MFGKDGKPSPGEVLRKEPLGRISFAHTDLTGDMEHHHAIKEGQRAVMQLLSSALS
jgi:spermidine dehydrogenase